MRSLLQRIPEWDARGLHQGLICQRTVCIIRDWCSKVHPTQERSLNFWDNILMLTSFYSLGWVKIRTPIHDKYFLVDFVFGIRNYTESSHIEPYFAADTLYKIQLLTNQKAPSQELASHWSKVGFYKGCPQQNKALYENFQYYSWFNTKNLQGNDCLGLGSGFSPTLLNISA